MVGQTVATSATAKRGIFDCCTVILHFDLLREIGVAAISRGELSMARNFQYPLTTICYTLYYIRDTLYA